MNKKETEALARAWFVHCIEHLSTCVLQDKRCALCTEFSRFDRFIANNDNKYLQGFSEYALKSWKKEAEP